MKEPVDFKKNPLVIPARIVCQFFMNKQRTILIEDESKTCHSCKLLRNLDRRGTECYVAGHRWYKFYKESGITEGDRVQFTVAGDSTKISVNIIRA